MTEQMGIFDTIYQCRAMRRLKPDPVPEELLLRLCEAGNQAPTGSNMQGVRWIIVRDAEQRASLAALNKRSVENYVGTRRVDDVPPTIRRSASGCSRPCSGRPSTSARCPR